MTPRPAVLAMLVLGGWILGCGSFTEPEPVEPSPVEQSVEQQVAAISASAGTDAAALDAALAAHGMTREAYEAALFDIAMDPARTRAYLAARGE